VVISTDQLHGAPDCFSRHVRQGNVMCSTVLGSTSGDRPRSAIRAIQVFELGASNADYFPGTDARQEGEPER
jgi:hypothetical protein